MKNAPYISVIVPMYNVERYVKLCIDSILTQTFQDFEIIIVDDASPDNSYNICRKLYGKNGKVRIIRHEKNQGLGPARNTGMKNARGEYIYFVDSDDLIIPTALEKLYNLNAKNGGNIDVIRTMSWYETAQDDDNPINLKTLRRRIEDKPEGFLMEDVVQRIEKFCAKNKIQYMAWMALYRRKFLEENNLEFPNCLYEDQPFSFEVICLAKTYFMTRETIYVMRYRTGSIQHSPGLEKLPQIFSAFTTTSNCVKKIANKFPALADKNFLLEQCIMEMFEPIFAAQMLPFYAKGNINETLDNALDKIFSQNFGESTSLAKYLLHSMALSRIQFSNLANQNRRLQDDVKKLAQSRNNLSSEVVQTFSRLDIIPNKIVFVNFSGKGYGCNPKYIAEEILRQGLPYDMVWLVNDVNEPMPAQIRKVKFNSVNSVYELSTAKVIITNVKHALPFVKKDGQFFIMTWHSDYWVKYIEKDCEKQLPASYIAESKQNSAITDLIISSSKLQTEEILRAYWYNGEIMECGLPRNDIFFNHTKDFVDKLKDKLNIPRENKVLIYAPTFRDNPAKFADVYSFNHKKLLDVVRKKFGGEWTLLLRFHPNVAHYGISEKLFGKSENVIDVTKYPDPQELLVISDVLVTDYSSVLYNFMVSRKPAFIFAKDVDTYPKERKLKPFYFELPYEINKTEEELFRCIKNFDETISNLRVSEFLSNVVPYDDGHASEKVVGVIKTVIKGDAMPAEKRGGVVPAEINLNRSLFKSVPNQNVDFLEKCMVNPIFLQNLMMLSKIPLQEKDAQNAMQILKLVEDKYYYELLDEKANHPWRPKILDVPTTVDKLLSSKKSLCRFGDGEIQIMQGSSIGFQEYDAELAEKLRKILAEGNADCYVGINRYYWYILDDPERNTNPHHKRFYTFNVPKYREFFATHCNKNKTYVDSCLGGYMSQKSLEFCQERFTKLQTLFKNRKLLIVAGETIFDSIENDFFAGAIHKEFLNAPKVNAYREFNDIMRKILRYPKDYLIVLILGPTATVLAYELSEHGYTAYDIGHLPKDYDAFVKRADRSSAAIAKFYSPD